jgi:hypothetical protein
MIFILSVWLEMVESQDHSIEIDLFDKAKFVSFKGTKVSISPVHFECIIIYFDLTRN